MPEEITRLNRFTTLPVLLDFLQRKKLVLLDPKIWEDKNDSEIILEYKKRKNIENLFAVCFSLNDETIHHWKTFSHGPAGCVIEFNAKKFFKVIDHIPGLIHRRVEYKKLADIEKKGFEIKTDDIPFIKRWPYRCEEEYRIIAEPAGKTDFFEIAIPLETINRITISQQMPEQIYKTIKGYLKNLNGDPDSRINRSTVYENKRWISRFKKGI
jgi:hypothetical protein